MITNNLEIEVKIKISDVEAIKEKLNRDKFKLLEPHSFEKNLVFEKGDGSLRRNQLLLRLRKIRDKNIITFKQPVGDSKESEGYKIREEIEIEVSDFENTVTIFRGLGFEVIFIYEKFREIYGDDKGKVMLDQTPIGNFLEIEGDEDYIDAVATSLGFSKSDYITANYMSLFREKFPFGHMQFETPKK